MRGLPQKRVLVTGAAGGIGAATVRRFLQEGARVWAVDRDEAGLERLLATMAEAGHELDGVSRTDVSDEAQVAAAFEAIHEQWEQCDVVINNAGISERVPFLELTPASWRAMLDSNLTGIFLVAQAAARVMIEGEGGVIVNMGSMNAHIASSNYAHYNASKAGVVELTRTMALELAPAVRVLSISPGKVTSLLPR